MEAFAGNPKLSNAMNPYTLVNEHGVRFILGPGRLSDCHLSSRLSDAQAQAMVDALNQIAMQPELPLEAESPDQMTLFPA